MAKTKANGKARKKANGKAKLGVIEAGRNRAVEVLREREELGGRIKLLEAEQAKLSDEWDEIIRRDSELCDEVDAADDVGVAHDTTDEEIESDELEKLMILPLPCGGTVTPETALAWLRDDFPHFQTVAYNVGADGPNQDTRTAACFLSLDLATAHEVCIRAVETGTPQSFKRDDNSMEWAFHTLYLTRVCDARSVMDHSTGPFEWAFDELAEELDRRLRVRCGCDEPADASSGDAEDESDEEIDPTERDATAMIHAPVLETTEDVADYLAGDFRMLCQAATDLAAAGIALPAMFYEDLAALAWAAACALRGEGSGGGKAKEPLNFLEDLAAAYTGMVRKLEESEDGPASFTAIDGSASEVCHSTMPILSRLVQDAAVQAGEEWAARHRNAL